MVKNPQATQAEEKLEDVETKIIQILMDGCPECSSDVLDEQSFSCFKESPSFLTYRARLEGTSERDSESLVSLTESWVRGGEAASVIVNGVLVGVDPNCSVAISSLSQPECSYTTPPPSTDRVCTSSNNTPSIVAGVVVVIVVLVIAVTALVVIALVRKIRQGGSVPTEVNER